MLPDATDSAEEKEVSLSSAAKTEAGSVCFLDLGGIPKTRKAKNSKIVR